MISFEERTVQFVIFSVASATAEMSVASNAARIAFEIMFPLPS